MEGTTLPTGIDRVQAEAFLSLPMIAELRGAMKWELTKIEKRGGARDAFGEWIDIEFVRDNLALKGNDRKDPARSVLAQVAQSWELLLMLPVLDAAVAEEGRVPPRFQIAVWLWDGAYLKSPRVSDAKATGRELEQAVNENAERIGIPTFLEVEHHRASPDSGPSAPLSLDLMDLV